MWVFAAEMKIATLRMIPANSIYRDKCVRFNQKYKNPEKTHLYY